MNKPNAKEITITPRIQVGKRYKVELRFDHMSWEWQGFWEPNTGEEGGLLIIEGGLLVDYDGCYNLPAEVCDLVEAAGIKVDPTVYPKECAA
jgi:hypothetical protein